MTEPTDSDRELAREAVLSCPTPPCGTYAEMAEWRATHWVEPFAKAVAAARRRGRQEECDTIAALLENVGREVWAAEIREGRWTGTKPGHKT